MIEAQTGKSIFADRGTAYATQTGWSLITSAFMPASPFEETLAVLKGMDLGPPPEYPLEKSPVLLLGAKGAEFLDTQEWKDAVHEVEKFRAAQREWQDKAKAHRAAMKVILARMNELKTVGHEAAGRVLPEKVAADEQ